MLLLAIETSCDETAAAVVRDGRTVLSSVISSQVAIHATYGGVVPEIASRRHLESIVTVVEESLHAGGISLDEIEGVAVTQGPGLVGALLVGIATAQGIAVAQGIPVVGVNHIEGHLLAILLEREVAFPFIALAVSGGHTHLYRVDGIGRYRTLGQTLDDAAGEAFDKVGKLLGLGYPAGAQIDRLAVAGDAGRIRFPRPLLHDGSCNFSFSGLKTAVLSQLRTEPELPSGGRLNDYCASFQAAACEVLVAKCAAALAMTGLSRLVVAGGVACNSGLRKSLAEMAAAQGVDLYLPAPSLCADNAAMIAVPGDFYLTNGVSGGTPLDALPVWPLDGLADRLQGLP